MCDEAVEEDLYLLEYVPDWFVTQEQIDVWDDDHDYYKYIEWYHGYQKQKAQKASIKEKFTPVAWHSSRHWDWCMSEDEKKRQKNYGHKHRLFLSLVTGYKNFLTQKELQIKMSSLLNISNASSKPKEFRLNDIEVVANSEEQNWIKQAHVGKFLDLTKILMSVKGIDAQEMPQRDDIKATVNQPYPWPGPRNHQNETDKFLSAFGVMYVIVESQKDKDKVLRKHILKDIISRGFDAKLKILQAASRPLS